jgi:hypothetical protein
LPVNGKRARSDRSRNASGWTPAATREAAVTVNARKLAELVPAPASLDRMETASRDELAAWQRERPVNGKRARSDRSRNASGWTPAASKAAR